MTASATAPPRPSGLRPRVAGAVLAGALAAALVGAAGTPAAQAGGAAGPAPVGGRELAGRGVLVHLRPGVPAPPRLKDAAYLLADLDSGAVILAQNPHQRHLPASTLKVLTALVQLPRVNPSAVVTATRADVAQDGTRVGMLVGARYSVRQLFQAMLMCSGNDAAWALARSGSGGMVATLRLMDAQARRLGALDTVARDPSGLDAPGQLSSAYDLALIARAALRLPAFRGYVTTRTATFPGGRAPAAHGRTTVRPAFAISTHNTLLLHYPGTIGVKNGYTVAARQTYIGAVHRGSHTYLLTEMGGASNSWRPRAALFDWAFAHAGAVAPVGTLVRPGTVCPTAGSTAACGRSTGVAAPPAPSARAAISATTPGSEASLGAVLPTGPAAGQRTAIAAAGAAALGVLVLLGALSRRRRRR